MNNDIKLQLIASQTHHSRHPPRPHIMISYIYHPHHIYYALYNISSEEQTVAHT